MGPAWNTTRNQLSKWALVPTLGVPAVAVILSFTYIKPEQRLAAVGVWALSGPGAMLVCLGFVLAWNALRQPARERNELRGTVATLERAEANRLYRAKNAINGQLIAAGHINRAEQTTAQLAGTVDIWIGKTVAVLESQAPEWRGYFVADSSDTGAGVFQGGQELEMENAIRERHLGRLNSHVERLRFIYLKTTGEDSTH